MFLAKYLIGVRRINMSKLNEVENSYLAYIKDINCHPLLSFEEEQKLAKKLRKKGYSISEIAKKLKMYKSGTISKWCCDIF